MVENKAPNSLRSSWYLLILCMIAYIFSYVDRQIVSLLIKNIRSDLQISDTQFSLIQGFSFAIFYTLTGLPIARLADTKPRPVVIATGIAVWSFATAICGITKTFWQLFFARMGVGVGEAALSPAAYSMITDSFPKSKLGLALGIYSMGSFIGAGLALIIGGVAIDWIASQVGTIELTWAGIVKPWQMTFFIVGLPGLMIAALFFLTVKDPKRKGVNISDQGFSIKQVLNYIREHKQTFLAHYLGFGLLSLLLFSLLSWAPAFLLRNFELTTRDVGVYLGTIILICNVSGVLCSGWLIDLYVKRGYQDAAMRLGIAGGIGALLPSAIFPFMGDLNSTLAMLSLAFFFASFPLATSAAALQVMAPNQMRSQVTAIFFLFMNLFGITGGASLVALSTDYLFKNEKSVGFSMALIACLAGLLAVLVMAPRLKHYRKTVNQLSASQLKS